LYSAQNETEHDRNKRERQKQARPIEERHGWKLFEGWPKQIVRNYLRHEIANSPGAPRIWVNTPDGNGAVSLTEERYYSGKINSR